MSPERLTRFQREQVFGGKVPRVGNIVLRLIGIKAARGIPFPLRCGIAPKNCSVLDWNLDQIPRKTLAKQYRKDLIPRSI